MQISLTPTAVSTILKIIEEQGEGKEEGPGLRVGARPGGCSGMQYGLNIENTPNDADEIIDVEGLRVFVDPESAKYLEGVEVDFVNTSMGSGFTFKNPNAGEGCNCGSTCCD